MSKHKQLPVKPDLKYLSSCLFFYVTPDSRNTVSWWTCPRPPVPLRSNIHMRSLTQPWAELNMKASTSIFTESSALPTDRKWSWQMLYRAIAVAVQHTVNMWHYQLMETAKKKKPHTKEDIMTHWMWMEAIRWSQLLSEQNFVVNESSETNGNPPPELRQSLMGFGVYASTCTRVLVIQPRASKQFVKSCSLAHLSKFKRKENTFISAR